MNWVIDIVLIAILLVGLVMGYKRGFVKTVAKPVKLVAVGGGSCAGATTHAGGDEDHLGVVAEEGTNVLDALFSCLAGHFGVVAGTKSLTQLYLDGDIGRNEGLTVGVTEYEGDVADAFAIHVLDGIATASTHTNYFDNVGICCWQIDGEYVSFFHKIR